MNNAFSTAHWPPASIGVRACDLGKCEALRLRKSQDDVCFGQLSRGGCIVYFLPSVLSTSTGILTQVSKQLFKVDPSSSASDSDACIKTPAEQRGIAKTAPLRTMPPSTTSATSSASSTGSGSASKSVMGKPPVKMPCWCGTRVQGRNV